MTLTSSLSIPGASVPCAGAPTSSELNSPAAVRGASASAGALCGRGVRFVDLESRSGKRYEGFVLTGDVLFRPWLARTLSRAATIVFENAG